MDAAEKADEVTAHRHEAKAADLATVDVVAKAAAEVKEADRAKVVRAVGPAILASSSIGS